MSSHPVLLAVARMSRAQSRGSGGQMSHANGFGSRRVRVIPVADKAGLTAWWAALLRRRLGGDVALIAQTFACTEQTARNWLAEFACPAGPALDLGCALWFEDFAERHGRGDLLRRAA
jgi:hypothetical protein